MSLLLPSYQKLLISPQELCIYRDLSFDHCLARLGKQWEIESRNELISKLHWCNQQVLDLDVEPLRGHWLPFSYSANTGSIGWCLPLEQAREPFHHQYVERCRQQIAFNQLIQPRTDIHRLAAPASSHGTKPNGFIFHLSRCGSTLVSGSLSEIEGVSVLSESSLLTDILLDDSLAENEKYHLLPAMLDCQGNIGIKNNKIIVKWNAWDLFYWPLIRKVYPDVPVLIIIREPVEILASHQYLAGRHMSGDPTLAKLDPAMAPAREGETILRFRIRVLRDLLERVRIIAQEPGVEIVDYRQINIKKITGMGAFFGLSISPMEADRIRERMQLHSKNPQQPFRSDSPEKQQMFREKEKELIHSILYGPYREILHYTATAQEIGLCGMT